MKDFQNGLYQKKKKKRKLKKKSVLTLKKGKERAMLSLKQKSHKNTQK